MQRDQSCMRGHLGPMTDSPQVTAVPQTDNRHTVLRAFLDPDIDGSFAEPLPEAELAIGHGHGIGIDENVEIAIRQNLALPEPLDVRRDPNQAVRVVAGQVRDNEVIGNARGFRGSAADAREDCSNEPFKRFRFQLHVFVAAR